MNGIIHIPARQVWGYFKRYEAELQTSLHNIAEWDECGVVVYLTAESDFPCFQVYLDDNIIDEMIAADPDECEADADEIYDTYLTPNLFGIMEEMQEKKDDLPNEIEDEVIEREDALDIALADFLEVALEGGEIPGNKSALDPEDELFQEIKEHFLEYLACDIGYSVYRPTIYEDAEGKSHFVEFPYQLYPESTSNSQD